MKRETRAEREIRYKALYEKKINKKAAEINKVMAKANYIEFNHDTDQYTLKFKNGQVFKFTPYFPCVFHENKIVPVLED